MQNSLNFICLSDSNFCLYGFCFSGDLNTNVDFSNFILVKIYSKFAAVGIGDGPRPVKFSMTLVGMSGRKSIKHYRYISKMKHVLSFKPLSRKMYFSCCR